MRFICVQLIVCEELTPTSIESFAYKYERKSKIIRTEISKYLELKIRNKVYIILLHVKNEKWKLTTDKNLKKLKSLILTHAPLAAFVYINEHAKFKYQQIAVS